MSILTVIGLVEVEIYHFFISHVTSCGHVTKGSNLPSVVAIRLVEVDIGPILIFNVRRRIHMIILLQSATIQIRMLFWHISYYKVRQGNFITKCGRLLLQSVSDISNCDRLLLQNVSGITKCDRLYYKVRQVLQSATDITKWDVTLWFWRYVYQEVVLCKWCL